MFFYVIYGQPFELDDPASCGSRSSSTSGHRGLTVDPRHLVNPDPARARHRLPLDELHRFPIPHLRFRRPPWPCFPRPLAAPWPRLGALTAPPPRLHYARDAMSRCSK